MIKSHAHILKHVHGSFLTYKHPHQFLFPAGIWLIPHGQIHPGGFLHNALLMAEQIKAFLSMIRTHTAVANAAKAHLGSCQMNDGIIDAAASIRGLRQYPLFDPLVFCKYIECQRFRSFLHKPNGFLYILYRYDR